MMEEKGKVPTDQEKLAKFRNQRSRAVELILNDNELKLFKNSRHIKEEFLGNLITLNFIAIMYQDKDENKEIHQLETPHYHVVLEFEGQYSFGSILDFTCAIFHCNANQISIMKADGEVPKRVRYLIHADDFDKFQYDPNDIVSNNLERVKRYIELDHIEDNAHCVSIVKKYHYDVEEILLHIDNYKSYRQIINDLIINHNRKW